MTLDSLRLALADIVTVTRRAFVNFGTHECTQRSAALAYYALFSIFPLLLLTISLLGFMLDAGVPLAVDAQTLVLRAVEQTMPQAKDMVAQIIVTISRTRGGTGLIGLLVLAWSASNMFSQARLALNAIWNIGQPQGIGGVLRLRFNALGMAVSTGLLLFVSTLSDTILELIARYATRLPWSATFWPLARPLVLVSMAVILFALLYRFLPSVPLGWGDVWPGAIVAGVGWELLKRGFVWYTTAVTDWTAVYGPITGVIGLLLWLYLSAQVLLFGAEFAAAYTRLLDEQEAVALPVDEPQESVEETETSELPVEPTVAPRARPGVARGTAVGLVGAGVAGGLALVGVVATGWRLLSRRERH